MQPNEELCSSIFFCSTATSSRLTKILIFHLEIIYMYRVCSKWVKKTAMVLCVTIKNHQRRGGRLDSVLSLVVLGCLGSYTTHPTPLTTPTNPLLLQPTLNEPKKLLLILIEPRSPRREEKSSFFFFFFSAPPSLNNRRRRLSKGGLVGCWRWYVVCSI